MTRQGIVNEVEQIINYLFNLADSKTGFKDNEKKETQDKINQLKNNGLKELVKEPTPKTINAPAKGEEPVY